MHYILAFYLNKILFLLTMDTANSKTFRNFTILKKVLLFLIKLNKTVVQSVPNTYIVYALYATEVPQFVGK